MAGPVAKRARNGSQQSSADKLRPSVARDLQAVFLTNSGGQHLPWVWHLSAEQINRVTYALTLLLAEEALFPWRAVAACFAVGFTEAGLPLGRVFGFGGRCRMFVLAASPIGAGGVRFVCALRGLLFFSLLLRRVP